MEAVEPTSINSAIRIVDFEGAHQADFERLNREWIERMFTMEPVDEFVLKNPVESIIAPGGAILMAMSGNTAAGTVGLRKVNDRTFEFTKMAVDPAFRRRGIAEALSKASFEKAKSLGASEVILYTNNKNVEAIRLYHRLGFEDIPLEPGVYARAEIKMRITIK